MTMAEKIKTARLKLHLSKAELARRLHTTTQAIYKYENGIVTNIPTDKLKLLAAELGVTPGYLLGDEDPESTALTEEELSKYGIERLEKKKIPLLGRVACGKPIFATEDHEHYATSLSSGDADFCLRAQGDSMIGARIFDGDILFIKACPVVENGDIAVILLDDEATVKRVYYDRENDLLTLMPENPLYPIIRRSGEELENVRILGKVISVQYELK